MKKIIIIFCSFWFLMSVFSCQHQPKKVIQPAKTPLIARVKAKVQVKDVKKGEVHYLDVTSVVDGTQRAKVEVRATMGILAAAIVMKENNIQYWIPHKEVVYEGAISQNSFKPLGALDIHPNVLFTLINDQVKLDSSWTCVMNQGFLSSCSNKKLGVTMTWSERVGLKRKITVISPRAEMIWIISSVEPIENVQDKDFVLPLPTAVKHISL